MTKQRVTLAVVVLAFAMVPAGVWAGMHGHGMGMGPGPGLGMGFDMGPGGFGLLGRMGDRLGLSDDQKTQIKAILEQEQAVVKPIHDQIKANQDTFMSTYDPAQFDEAKVRAQITLQTPLFQQLALEQARAHAKVLQVLTADQRAQLQELRQHAHGSGGPGNGTGSGPGPRH